MQSSSFTKVRRPKIWLSQIAAHDSFDISTKTIAVCHWEGKNLRNWRECVMGIEFGEHSLEELYQRSILAHTRSHLLHLQCIWAAYFLLMSLVHLAQLDFILVCSSVSATICLLIQSILLIRPSLVRYLLYATVQLLALSSIALCSSPHTALLPTALSIFTIYALIPVHLFCSLIVCAALSLLQLVAFYFLATPFTIGQVCWTFPFLIMLSIPSCWRFHLPRIGLFRNMRIIRVSMIAVARIPTQRWYETFCLFIFCLI